MAGLTEAARLFARAEELRDAGDDAAALEKVEKSLELEPDNAPAQIFKHWVQKFGVGSEADTTVRRVLACPAGDFYAVLDAPRFAPPPRAEYLRLSLLLHPTRAGARNTGAAYSRVTEAFNVLKDPTERAKYDDKLRRATDASSSARPATARQPFQRPPNGGGGGSTRPPHGHHYSSSARGGAPSSSYPIAQLRDARAAARPRAPPRPRAARRGDQHALADAARRAAARGAHPAGGTAPRAGGPAGAVPLGV